MSTLDNRSDSLIVARGPPSQNITLVPARSTVVLATPPTQLMTLDSPHSEESTESNDTCNEDSDNGDGPNATSSRDRESRTTAGDSESKKLKRFR
jgi:hypothetical protein